MRLSALMALGAVAACAPSNQDNTSAAAEDALIAADEALMAANNEVAAANEAVPASDTQPTWTYTTNTDPMSDEKTELACVQSSNSIYLSPPYGETGARLCLRNSPQFGRDAYVSLNENGQILCRSYESCRIRVRFDKAPAESWSAIGPSDHSSDMVFIENRSAFERKLRTAKTTNVQLEFYQNGMQTFTFNTAGLNWGKSTKAGDE